VAVLDGDFGVGGGDEDGDAGAVRANVDSEVAAWEGLVGGLDKNEGEQEGGRLCRKANCSLSAQKSPNWSLPMVPVMGWLEWEGLLEGQTELTGWMFRPVAGKTQSVVSRVDRQL